MKTTLNLDDALLRAAKKRAAEESRTLTSVIEDALRLALATRSRPHDYRLDLPVVQGAVAAVDIADRDALYDRLGGRR